MSEPGKIDTPFDAPSGGPLSVLDSQLEAPPMGSMGGMPLGDSGAMSMQAVPLPEDDVQG